MTSWSTAASGARSRPRATCISTRTARWCRGSRSTARSPPPFPVRPPPSPILPRAAALFLEVGAVPRLGYVIRQPDLAATLSALAEHGADGFYQGPVAERLVQGVRAAGGIWTREDLEQYRVVERPPVVGEYRGWRVVSASPPSSGGIALITMLNILAGYDLDQAARDHVIVEAMRRAYRDRADYLGDPDFVKIPVARLIHPFYAAGLRATINPDRATPSALLPGNLDDPRGADTTHFSILDREGNRVAATLSVNLPFGAGFVAPGTGVLLNNEMDDFSAKPGAPNMYGLVGDAANAIAPGKRPLSSMTPTILDGARGVAVLGTPGGSRIITMVLLGALDIMHGGDAASAAAVKRFHHQFLPDAIQYEHGGFTPEVAAALTARGHLLNPLARSYGNKQVVWWDRAKRQVQAASDPRGVGAAELR